jgi:hypothetical protein
LLLRRFGGRLADLAIRLTNSKLGPVGGSGYSMKAF